MTTSHKSVGTHGFGYPVKLIREGKDGGVLVRCRDLPEVVTQGEYPGHALEQAVGALQAAVEMRLEDGLDIPTPSRQRQREHWIALPVTTAVKAALYVTMRDQGISKSELARLLQMDEKEARRILNPKHATKINTLERALHVLGKRVEVLIA